MEKVTISELKNRLSAFLKKVQAGRTVIVLDRNRPIARIERIEAGGPSDDRLASLERRGLLRRASRRLAVDDIRSGAPRSKRSVVEALLEDRRDGR
jgi:antitoxin (DNA-binding transcriptional repressor) of toxin-antitoxin stability system